MGRSAIRFVWKGYPEWTVGYCRNLNETPTRTSQARRPRWSQERTSSMSLSKEKISRRHHPLPHLGAPLRPLYSVFISFEWRWTLPPSAAPLTDRAFTLVGLGHPPNTPLGGCPPSNGPLGGWPNGASIPVGFAQSANATFVEQSVHPCRVTQSTNALGELY